MLFESPIRLLSRLGFDFGAVGLDFRLFAWLKGVGRAISAVRVRFVLRVFCFLWRFYPLVNCVFGWFITVSERKSDKSCRDSPRKIRYADDVGLNVVEYVFLWGAITANRMFLPQVRIYLTLRADYGSGRVRRAFRRCGHRIDCFCKHGCRRLGSNENMLLYAGGKKQ